MTNTELLTNAMIVATQALSDYRTDPSTDPTDALEDAETVLLDVLDSIGKGDHPDAIGDFHPLRELARNVLTLIDQAR